MAEKLAHDLEWIADRSVRLYLRTLVATGVARAAPVAARGVFGPAPIDSARCAGSAGSPRAAAPVERSRLDAMSATLVHRGPDSDGTFLDDGVGLAARRLSIIDLDGGDQPIANEDGTIHVVQNGEIYNYARAARASSSATATASATRGDTEVLVHLYEQHGARLRRARCAACSRSRSGTRRAGGSCSRATASGSSRCYYRDVGERARVRVGAARPAARRDRPRRARGVPRVQLDPGAADDLPRGPQAAARARARSGRAASRELAALRAARAGAGERGAARRRGRARRGAAGAAARLGARAPRRATCRSACCSRAASTRRCSRRSPRRSSPSRCGRSRSGSRSARSTSSPTRASSRERYATEHHELVAAARRGAAAARARRGVRRAVRRLVGAADLPRLRARGRAT